MSTRRADRPTTRAFVLVVALVVGSLAATTGPPARADDVRDPLETLVATWSAALAAVPSADWSLVVRDGDGVVRVAHRPDARLLPASTHKLVTAAAALTTLGPHTTFVTRAETLDPVVDGTVEGDLHLVGGWDPTLVTEDFARWAYPERPASRLDVLADAVAAAGVRNVRGAVVATSRPYDPVHVAPGWPTRYFEDLDARVITGLTIDAGLDVHYTWDVPPVSVETGREPGEERPPPDRVAAELAPRPDLAAARVFDELLRDRGVDVGQPPRGSEPLTPPGRVVAQIRGGPVGDIVTNFLRTSDNHLADTVFRALGAAVRDDASWEAGERAARAALTSLGVDVSAVRLADGSGLSRENRLTTRILSAIDHHMVAGPLSRHWRNAHAVAGESGTLRTRLRGTVAAGRFAGKTGSLRDVMAITGTVAGSRRVVHLALIINDLEGVDRRVGRAVVDRTVELLTAYADGCAVTIAIDADEMPVDPRMPPLGDLARACG